MDINIVDLAKMRNDEHFQFMTVIACAIVEFGGAENLRIGTYYDRFESDVQLEDVTLKKIPKSSITQLIQTADQYRDEIFRGIVSIVDAHLNHFEVALREPARKVKIVLNTYGNVARKPLNEETSAIYNLLTDLNSDKYLPDAKTTGLEDWMAALATANTALNDLMTERFHESAAKTEAVLKEVRLKVDAGYRDIVHLVEAFSMVYGEEEGAPFIPFIRYVNTIVDKYNNIIAARYGRNND